MREENWKYVIGYEGIYEVSDMGNIRGVTRLSTQGNRWGRKHSSKLSGMNMKASTHHTGYKVISLHKNGTSKQYRVHRLVMEAFCGLASGRIVNHINLIRGDNRVENLEWTDHTGNAKHAKENARILSGESHPNAILSKTQVLQIVKEKKTGMGVRQAAKKFKTSPATIHRIWKGKTRVSETGI